MTLTIDEQERLAYITGDVVLAKALASYDEGRTAGYDKGYDDGYVDGVNESGPDPLS